MPELNILTSILCLLLAFEIGQSIEKEALIEVATIKDLEIPWMWISPNAANEENMPKLVEVIDVVKGKETAKYDDGSIAPVHKSQPRFIGNLKNKLCKVGLGIGKSYLECFEEVNSLIHNRVKRSPQFVKGDPDSVKPESDQPASDLTESDQAVEAANDKENPSTRLFGLNGLDGLTGLLKPTIDPSVGLFFGNPFYNGVRGSKGPFQIDLGPISVNPFGQLRFTLNNGRPIIRPSLDFLVSSNKKGGHFPPNHQQGPSYIEYSSPLETALYSPPIQTSPYSPPVHNAPYSPPVHNTQYSPHLPFPPYSPHFKTQEYPEYPKPPKYPNHIRTPQYARPTPHSYKTPQHSNYLSLYEDRNARKESLPKYPTLANTVDSFGYPPSSHSDLKFTSEEPDSNLFLPLADNDDQFHGYPPSSSNFEFTNADPVSPFPSPINNNRGYGYPPSSSSSAFIPENNLKQFTSLKDSKTFGYPPSTSSTEFRPSPPLKSGVLERPKPLSFSGFLAARDSVRDDRDEIFSQKNK